MPDFTTLVWLLPLIFMIHDFEEIIFFKYWVNKNKDSLSQQYPRLAKRFLSRFEELSVPAFTVAVAEEFVFLSIVTVVSVTAGNYLFWLGIFMGFFVHLIIHLVQWIIIRKYIPAIYTTLFSSAYCIFTLYYVLKKELFSLHEILLWTGIGFVVVILNLLFAHRLAHWFDRKIKGHEL